MTDRQDVSDLLNEWSAGRAEALEQLMPLVERELKAASHR